MSRETLLDDAIAKAKADEDWQLVEWLRMARGGESAARWYTAKLGEARLDMSKLMTENAKLRKLCAGLLTGYECGYGELCKGCTWDGIGDSKTFSCLPRAKARELGVEADDG